MTPEKDAGSANAGTNRLLFGDNLTMLRDRTLFPDESVDLIYLDPPFNSNATYNMLFREESGEISRAQFHAFTDTWHWVDAEPTYREFLKTCKLANVVTTVESLHAALKASVMMAYVAMMAPRLGELHRILKPTGSIYLHCDPTASHYLRVLMDAIFDPRNFRNEIVWQRTSAHSDARQGAQHFGRVQDYLLFYSKSDKVTWNPQYVTHDEQYVRTHYPYVVKETARRYGLWDITGPGGAAKGNPYYEVLGIKKHWRYSQDKMKQKIREGRIIQPRHGSIPREIRYLDESHGVPVGSVWTDIPPINSQAKERLGYPTQKPEALLERIIKSSSNESDIVLDPFCGCGTTIAVAQRLKRTWIGIDITYLAINLIKRRLDSAFGKSVVSFVERGQPVDLSGAQRLAALDRFQFQQWALNLVGALPMKAGPGKGADRGVDGLLFFHEAKDIRPKILVQVKSGGIKRDDVVTLLGDVANQKAVGGILITLEPPTEPMKKEAVEAGRYASKLWKKRDYPKIQILTIGGLLNRTERPDTPPLEDPFAKAPRTDTTEQYNLPD